MGFICKFFGCRRRNIHVLSRDDVYDTETDDEAIESSSLRENLIDPEQTPELSPAINTTNQINIETLCALYEKQHLTIRRNERQRKGFYGMQ